MNDDAALLRRYVEEGADSAFTELVRRHVDLVYGAAMRRTEGDPHRSTEVAQQVFTTLAQQAEKLAAHPALSAWLHTATRNAAVNLMISEQRRRTREQVAFALAPEPKFETAGLDWDRVRPVLDAAIDELPGPDRTAIVLRFLERSSFSRIGAALRVTEDAARMRTDRALEKLRLALARRGITSTASALGTLVTSQPILSAPLGLSGSLATQALSAVAVGTNTGALFSFTTLMNAKLVTTAAVSALLFFGLGVYVGFDATARLPLPPLAVVPDGPQKIAALREQNLRLQAQIDQLNTKPASVAAPRSAPPPAAPSRPLSAEAELVRLSEHKAIRNNLRQISAVADKFQADHGRAPTSLDEIVGEGKYIRQLVPVNGENYANLSLVKGMPLTVFPADGEPVTYDPTAIPPQPTPEMARVNELTQKLRPSISKAVEAYRTAHNGQNPPRENPIAMLPYFASPQEGADFVELLEAQKAAVGK